MAKKAQLCNPALKLRFCTMKNTLLLFVLALCWSACKNDGAEAVTEIRDSKGPNSSMVRNPATADMESDTNKLARITFDEPVFNFGKVDEGEVVEHKFKFKNTGKVPLIILNARSSCGCTVPEWPDDPIPPGGTGEILAKFNTTGKPRDQKKMITITANTYPNLTNVALMGKVIPK